MQKPQVDGQHLESQSHSSKTQIVYGNSTAYLVELHESVQSLINSLQELR